MHEIGILLPDELYPIGENTVILDVRSPSEFNKGHIPGASNLPLFSDEERIKVGTTYIQKNKQDALLLGFDIAGKKMRKLVEDALAVTNNSQAIIYCWRGGMRSKSMAWLLNFSGIKLKVLKGGYKAYRRMVIHGFDKPELILLGGYTGSGKSEILNELSRLNQQIIDLEAIANHKGSAFGGLGKSKQCSSEQFENNLYQEWFKLDKNKPVWLEDESFSIGSVNLPYPLHVRMKKADLFFLNTPFEKRVKRLVEEYGGFSAEQLAGCFEKIKKKLSLQFYHQAIQHIESGQMGMAAAIALNYYDKSYEKSMKNKIEGNLHIIETKTATLLQQAQILIHSATKIL